MADTKVASPTVPGVTSPKAKLKEKEQEKDPLSSNFRTVFADPSNFNIKHPLQNQWALWYDNPGKKTSQSSWGDHLKRIYTIDSVEDFWCLFNNIKAASELGHGSNYHLFKEHIEPKWEDKNNEQGGKWVLSLSRAKKDSIDKLWLWAMLACIGEGFGETDEVCGIVVNIRKQAYRICLWTKTASDEASVLHLGRTLKRVLELDEKSTIQYTDHKEAMKTSNVSFRHEI